MTAAETVPQPSGDSLPTFEDLDPRTGEVIAHVPEHGAAEVEAAVDRARIAFADWSELPVAERVEHLVAVRDLILDRAERIVEVVCRETGKLEAEAVSTEILVACELIEFYRRHGAKALRPARVPTGSLFATKKAWRSYEPRGVVAVISPWNYPFNLAMGPIVSALIAGNTAVLKPSEVTPLVGVEIGRLFAEVGGHPDIVQVVTGAGATGEALVNSDVQMIAFTGSVRTGRRIMQAAAERLTPVLLELGGKDPMIVCEDADVGKAAKGAVWGAFMNSGQTCISVERVYVHEAIYDRFVDQVVSEAEAVRQGVGPGHDVGSMTFGPQVDIVERHVDDARAKGARVLSGGRPRPDLGPFFYEPTILADVTPDMLCHATETFGPVVSLYPFRTDDEAVALANQTEYGLNASVFGRDRVRAHAVAARIRAGAVNINDGVVSAYSSTDAPMGGMGASGLGRRHGAEGILKYTEGQTIAVQRLPVLSPPRWMPYKPFTRTMVALLRLLHRLRIR